MLYRMPKATDFAYIRDFHCVIWSILYPTQQFTEVDMDNINNLILQKRKELGLTQSELGAMLGISGKAVSKWERGLSMPCEEHLEKLIDLLGLQIEQKIAEPELPPTFLSTVKSELIRILSAGVMTAVCVCNMAGIISTDSTVVSLGFSAALFCFCTMIKG